MTKEQINQLETEIETIVTNNARQIIESGHTSIARYFIDNRLIDVNDSDIKDYLITHYDYLPFDEYIKYYYQTVCACIDEQGNSEMIALCLCETSDIIEVFEQRHDCRCELLPSGFLNHYSPWVEALKDADLHGHITGILRVTTDYGTNYIALYNEMMR